MDSPYVPEGSCGLLWAQSQAVAEAVRVQIEDSHGDCQNQDEATQVAFWAGTILSCHRPWPVGFWPQSYSSMSRDTRKEAWRDPRSPCFADEVAQAPGAEGFSLKL